MKKKLLALLLAGALMFALSACTDGGGQPAPGGDNPTAPQPIAKEDLKIGFIHIGDESDMGYTYNQVVGAGKMMENLGIADEQVLVKYNISEDDKCADALNELIEAGCKIIFTTSYGFQEYALEAAKENPQVQFCQATGNLAASSGLANMHNYFANIYEGRYLAGIAAGMKAKEQNNPKLGYVGAFNYAEVISGYTAFYLGAHSVYPEVTMEVIYTKTWNNANKESQTAEALINRGCGVLSQHSDSTGPATKAEQMGAFQAGYNADMIAAAPGSSLISTTIDWSIYLTEAVQHMIDGTAIPTDWCAGLADGAVIMTPLNTAIAAEGTQQAIDAAAEAIKAGTLQVFSGPMHGVSLSTGEELNLAEGETFIESDVANGKTSAPYFDYIIDGVTEVTGG